MPFTSGKQFNCKISQNNFLPVDIIGSVKVSRRAPVGEGRFASWELLVAPNPS